MGYLTLLAEEVISAIDRFPQDLSTQITSLYAPQPEWEEYVKGRYSETKKKMQWLWADLSQTFLLHLV